VETWGLGGVNKETTYNARRGDDGTADLILALSASMRSPISS